MKWRGFTSLIHIHLGTTGRRVKKHPEKNQRGRTTGLGGRDFEEIILGFEARSRRTHKCGGRAEITQEEGGGWGGEKE